MQAAMDLWQAMGDDAVAENSAYLTEQLITYIGNKRSLLDFIGNGARIVKRRLGKQKLSSFDVFSGSGVVARYLRRDSSRIVTNDLEKYSAVINKCYQASPTPELLRALKQEHARLLRRLDTEELKPGLISEFYAPKDDNDVQMGERCFYTTRNARYLDTARRMLDDVPEEFRGYLLAPLIAKASVHANTSGVFKGFYKNTETGLGQFGGNNQDALLRIKSDITLPFPIFSNYAVDAEVYNRDANDLIHELDEVDLAYLDPPYNQHPYGSNYFMLNLLVDYERPQEVSNISGIPVDWNRSRYNKRGEALEALTALVNGIRAKFVMISFNSEGFISREDMVEMLEKVGQVEVLETKYNTFRGSRNLRDRDIHVKEFLFLVEKA